MSGDLPYLPPLKSSHQCRRCRRWLEGEWFDADAAGRVEIQRQMDAGRCDDCTRREAADLAAVASAPDPGGPEDWPAAIGRMGRVWAVRTLPGTLREPVVIVKINPPSGGRNHAMITAFDPAAFRALVAKMQQVADSLPADEGSPT